MPAEKMDPYEDSRNKVMAEAQGALETLDQEDPSLDPPERISCPQALRDQHSDNCENDRDASINRARVQEQVDFVPPVDPQELIDQGQGDQFNVNWGLIASIRNEAVSAYLDIFTSPVNLVKIPLNETMDEDQREVWGGVMADKFTKMLRKWDGAVPQMLCLADIFVTHGIGIPWFQDSRCLFFDVASLEDFKFDANALAVSSKVECCTADRIMSVPELYAKIENAPEGAEWHDGWNVAMLEQVILDAKPSNLVDDDWNMEKLARRVKANRMSVNTNLGQCPLVWGIIRELDGRISVYATTKEKCEKWKESDWDSGIDEEPWLYRKRFAYEDAQQAFLIFPFSVGNKLEIYTVRGLAYFLYEAGQADNMLRNKMMNAARARSTEMWQSDGGVEVAEDLQFIDIGYGMIAPTGLRKVEQPMGLPLDKSIGYALEANQQILDRHSGGLASGALLDNPAARRNEMQVAAELEHINKMLSFAISLFYAPYDALMRELVRRAFTCAQDDLVAKNLVKQMKEDCKKAGVPEDAFDAIDFENISATRVTGAGSRSSRITMYTQMTQFYAEMDPTGQEFFAYDFATEIGGIDRAERYFGRPGVRRDHIDESLIQLENARLKEGDFLDPIAGENKMLHLEGHLAELEEGLQGVDEGLVDIGVFAMNNVSLYKHASDTMEQTTVHETRLSQLNLIRQRLQQIGEIMDNGFRHIRAEQRKGNPLPGEAQQNGSGDPEADAAAAEQEREEIKFQNEEARKDQEHQAKQYRIFQEGYQKLQLMKQLGQAKIDNERAKTMANIAALDAKTAQAIRQAGTMSKTNKEG